MTALRMPGLLVCAGLVGVPSGCDEWSFDGVYDPLRCDPRCEAPTSCENGVCVSSLGSCGNDAREGIEECDGKDLDGKTCQSLGHLSGALRCTSSCRLDKSGCGDCVPPTCCLSELTRVRTSTPVHDIFAVGNYVYVSSYEGIRILYMGDPDRPQDRGRLGGMGEDFRDVAATSAGFLAVRSGRHVFVAGVSGDHTQGEIVASNPPRDAPEKSRIVDTWASQNHFLMLDSHNIDGSGTLRILTTKLETVPDPKPGDPKAVTSFFDVGEVSGLYHATALALDGQMAFVADDKAGTVQAIDIADPTMPKRAGALQLTTNLGIHAMAAVEGRLYVGVMREIQIVDVRDSSIMQKLSSFELPDGINSNGNDAIVIDSETTRLYALTGNDVVVVDISDETNPKLLGSHTGPDIAEGLWLFDSDHLLLAAGTAGVVVLSTRCPSP